MEEALADEPRRTDDGDHTFGRYRIVRTLAFGGMAQILLATDKSNQLVVLKRILPHFADNEDFVQYFIHEGRLGQRLLHPNIVKTIEAGQVGKTCYIALEYLRGKTAIEVLRAAARAKVEVPLGVAVRIVADAARGLHHAHTATGDDGRPLNVVHRDVTPHNLYVCADGVTKVLDFGIAKAASQLHQTRTGTIKGKFAYLAPEQIKGESIDRRVDVFALGIVLHELLTLRPLFRGQNDGETLQKVLSLDVLPPEAVRKCVPPGLGAVALRALQRDRERRLPSAEALADSIEAVATAYGIDASHEAVERLLVKLFPDPEELGELEPPPPDRAEVATEVRPDETPPRIVSVEKVAAELDNLPTAPVPIAKAASDVQSTHTRALAARRRTGQVAALLAAASVMFALVLTSTTCFDRLTGQNPEAVVPVPRAPVGSGGPTPVEEPKAAPREPEPVPAVPAVAAPKAAPVLERPPAEATLRVQTDGPASFTVDGRAQKPAADGALHLAPGRHTVVVSSPVLAYSRTLQVDLKPNEAALRAVHAGRGHLRVAVTPWAEVIIDGRAVGVTPLQPQELPEGTHHVSLKNPDLGVTVKRRVIVAPNKEAVLKVDLFSEKKN